MGTKEGTCDEYWVSDVSDESLGSTPEAKTILYVNQLKFKLKKKKKIKKTYLTSLVSKVEFRIQAGG